MPYILLYFKSKNDLYLAKIWLNKVLFCIFVLYINTKNKNIIVHNP